MFSGVKYYFLSPKVVGNADDVEIVLEKVGYFAFNFFDLHFYSTSYYDVVTSPNP